MVFSNGYYYDTPVPSGSSNADLVTAISAINTKLDNYATKAALQFVDAQLASVGSSLQQYAKKTDIPASADLSLYAKKTDIPTAVDLSGYTTNASLSGILDFYAKKTDITNSAPKVYGSTQSGDTGHYLTECSSIANGGNTIHTCTPTANVSGYTYAVLYLGNLSNTSTDEFWFTVVNCSTSISLTPGTPLGGFNWVHPNGSTKYNFCPVAIPPMTAQTFVRLNMTTVQNPSGFSVIFGPL